MAEKGPPSLLDEPNPWTDPPNRSQPPHSPARTDNSRSQQPFTPRSSSFPDDSDSEFDIVEHTPIHSPSGPDYDDLPPSYEQAQAQALEQARTGHTPPNPNDLQVHRLVLESAPDPDFSIPSPTHAQPANFQPIPNAAGLGSTVPITEISGSTTIPVHQIPTSPPDPFTVLLNRALEFTQYAPDEDLQYAPRLTRAVAIPQEGVLTPCTTNSSTIPGCHGRHGHPAPPFGRGGRRGRHDHWHHPSTPDLSSETLNAQERTPIQFLRSYAKVLHTHSIRPAEFASFLDSLNVICTATTATPESLLSNTANHSGASSTTASLVESYIAKCNEIFFAPRGLRVRLSSLSSLVSTLNIPTDRGQQAAAVASATDPSTNPAQHAQALHPWIERLELDVPEPAGSMLVLQAMGERVKAQTEAASRSSMDDTHMRGPPPFGFGLHHAATAPTFPPWGRGPGGFPPWAGTGARGRHGPGPFMRGPGAAGPPWGGRGPPWARGGVPWAGRGGARGFGPGFGRGGCGFGGPQPPSGQQRGSGQSWEEWGEELGKRWGAWGENFGKMAEAWGENLGKKAEVWGEEIGKKAEAWGEDIEKKVSGESSRPRGWACSSSENHIGVPLVDLSDPTPTEPGQETGVTATEAHPPKPEDDDDDSSSDSDSDSSFSSDDEDDDFEDPQDLFINRVREINTKAASAAEKGKKSPEDIAQERDMAIAKAQSQKTALELKIEEKREKRAVKRELRAKKREIKKEIRRKRKEIKASRWPVKEERRKMKEEWHAKKKEHKLLKQEMKKEWRDKRRERKWARKGHGAARHEEGAEKMVWVVVENLVD